MNQLADKTVPFVPDRPAELHQQIRIKLALSPWERAASKQLRRDVFCQEQGVFQEDDSDEIDQIAMPIVALLEDAHGKSEVVGTVRIHEPEPGLWHGSRLAVAQHARRIGSVGSGLIKLAVSTAHAHGCHTFLAQVQSQNAALFRRLHWHTLAELEIHGRPHHLMQAELDFYPPMSDGDRGFVLTHHAARGKS